MKRKKEYESPYRKNAANGNIIIDIALDDYMDFFHEWDNAVFKKRDMHPELAEFLDLCSEDIPLRKRLEIQFYVRDDAVDKKKEKLICASYHTYYNFQERVENRKIRNIYRSSAVLLLLALAFIFIHIILSGIMESGVWAKVFLEGLIIGGWVFMWEALEMAFFISMEPLRRRREIRRFLKADLGFTYQKMPE